MSQTTQDRLSQVKNILTLEKAATTIPFDPNCTTFPSRKDVPTVLGAPPGAAWVWGENDQIGRLNLLTPTRVKASAVAEIRTGEMISLNLPLHEPEVPAFEREPFQHSIKTLKENVSYDDTYTMNTQSGTQWDGFRHFSHIPTGKFYNNSHASDFTGPSANEKASIHHWHEHGIAGRGILLDYLSYAETKGIKYNCYESHRISWDELNACGRQQGIDIRPEAQGGDVKIGDLLFIRSGWIVSYLGKPKEERARLAKREGAIGPHAGQLYAGVKQEEKMLDWLHDCYFAAVAGDSPTFEAWPTDQEYFLHEYLLALWGCPLGEMHNLEDLSKKCHKLNRWTFFVNSVPARCHGGVGSHANAMAFF